jgi:hypothetical protein
MTTKELIKAEIDRLPEEALDEVYNLIKSFSKSAAKDAEQSILVKLSSIQFDGPEDLSANHDLYLSGEKCEEPDIS